MDWPARAAKPRQWTSNGARAPHKPLLLLYALGSSTSPCPGARRRGCKAMDERRAITALLKP
ncbi:hypothetical protein GCM10017687_85450 [Streptomyces echinatus]|uniref:Uncharacterized protein n=1 Tax=Streptomyces echinatus TaxID=67293 RepID=A0A7W9Q1P4_9ACTN|nr:hypothetical protein [Streptomyces echinatus]